jgi:hypothetical protein
MFADSSAATGLERLDPPTRARVLMALLALILLGVTLVACAMIGGRWVRRLARHKPRRAARHRHPFGGSTLRPSMDPTAGPMGDTLVAEHRTDETRIDHS